MHLPVLLFSYIQLHIFIYPRSKVYLFYVFLWGNELCVHVMPSTVAL